MGEVCIHECALKRFHEACTEFESKSKELHLLTLHLSLECLQSRKDQKKVHAGTLKKFRKKDYLKALVVKVSALRNSNGGFLLVHICDKKTQDKSLNLSFFDEFADSKLKKLICDGSLFTDCYDRWILCDSVESVFQQYNNVIVLKVNKTKGVSTVEYNTKIGSDHEIEEPKFYELYSLLTKGSNQRSSKGEARGIKKDKLYESRSVQLKSFPQQDEKYQEILDKEDIIGLVDCIWDKLRLPEYIASMSNIPTGGSYYVGIVEEKGSKPLRIEGFKFDVSKQDDILINLKIKLDSLLILKDIDSEFEIGDSTKNLISIKVYPVTPSHVVLEVCIGYRPGVVFFGEGPSAYKMKGRGIEPIPIREWRILFKSFFQG